LEVLKVPLCLDEVAERRRHVEMLIDVRHIKEAVARPVRITEYARHDGVIETVEDLQYFILDTRDRGQLPNL